MVHAIAHKATEIMGVANIIRRTASSISRASRLMDMLHISLSPELSSKTQDAQRQIDELKNSIRKEEIIINDVRNNLKEVTADIGRIVELFDLIKSICAFIAIFVLCLIVIILIVVAGRG